MGLVQYFVDEAGDTTLFGRYGKVLASTDAVSRFFMVARLEVDDIGALQAEMDALRAELLADPLLRSVPSMQAAAGKTALFFHAKDDAPEVRHAVFKLLLRHDLRLSAVVKEKQHLLADVHRHQAINPKYRYKADGHDIYDDLIAKLFGRFGEFGVQRHITFAVRGSKPRTTALKTVLDNIDEAFKGDFGFAPLLMISSVNKSTALSMGSPSARSIGVRPAAFFSSTGAPFSARKRITSQTRSCAS